MGHNYEDENYGCIDFNCFYPRYGRLYLGDGNGGFLRGGQAKKAESAFPETLNNGEVIVQQGTPVIEESGAYVVGQPSIPVSPGVSTQTVPPPLSPQNTLPLSPTPNNPAPKLVPQAQPIPANPTSRIIN